MEMLTGKGKHAVKVGNHPHKYDIEVSSHENRRAQMQDNWKCIPKIKHQQGLP